MDYYWYFGLLQFISKLSHSFEQVNLILILNFLSVKTIAVQVLNVINLLNSKGHLDTDLNSILKSVTSGALAIAPISSSSTSSVALTLLYFIC